MILISQSPRCIFRTAFLLSVFLVSSTLSFPKEKINNWLPAPKAPFNFMLRVYWPKEEMTNGKWNVVPLNEALVAIDELWDNVFQYNQKVDSLKN